MREEFKEGEMFENLIKKYLIDNSHKLTLTMIPDERVGDLEEKHEAAKLKALVNALNDQEKETILTEAYNL